MSVEFRWEDDDKAFRALQRRLRGLERQVVTVGVHGDAGTHGDSGFKMPELAAVHEFGDQAERIPERSFIRAGIDAGQKEILDEVEKAVAQMCDVSQDAVLPHTVADLAGVLLEGAIKERIATGIDPRLAQATRDRRDKKAEHGGGLVAQIGQYTPLHDTGQLLQSITFKRGSDDGENR